MRRLLIVLLLAAAPVSASAQHAHERAPSPYAGEESRAIKSLSADDIAELRRGGGWGLARAAELNGVPGPAHLLELKDAIPLSADQVARIEAIHAKMVARAVVLGERLIEREWALENAFRAGTVDAASLRRLLDAIARTRAELRYVHLATHLETPALLAEAQIARYNALRGYAANDPCAAPPPAGHDAALWRRHNGCD